MTYFEVKVRYSQQGERSTLVKQQQDVFLINTLTFGNAEEVAVKQVKDFTLDGDVVVMAIKKVTFENLLLETEDHLGKSFYKAKIMLEMIDETAGKIKKLPQAILVEDVDVAAAHKRVQEFLKDCIWDYTIDDVVKTKIVQYIDK